MNDHIAPHSSAHFTQGYVHHLTRIADARRRLPHNFKGHCPDVETTVAILSNGEVAVQVMEQSSKRIQHFHLSSDYKPGELVARLSSFLKLGEGAVRFEDDLLQSINEAADELGIEPFDNLLACYVANHYMLQGELVAIVNQFKL